MMEYRDFHDKLIVKTLETFGVSRAGYNKVFGKIPSVVPFHIKWMIAMYMELYDIDEFDFDKYKDIIEIRIK